MQILWLPQKSSKICIHIKVQCANCGDSHFANSNRCNLRHKAEIDACRKKTQDKDKRKIVEPVEQDHGSQKTSSKLEIRIDLEAERWAKNAKRESFDQNEIPERINHTQYF